MYDNIPSIANNEILFTKRLKHALSTELHVFYIDSFYRRMYEWRIAARSPHYQNNQVQSEPDSLDTHFFQRAISHFN